MESKIRATNRKLTQTEYERLGLKNSNPKATRYIKINGRTYIYHPFRSSKEQYYDVLIRDEITKVCFGVTYSPKSTSVCLAEAIEEPFGCQKRALIA